MVKSAGLLGITVSLADLKSAAEMVINSIPHKRGDFFCFSNIHTLMESLRDNQLNKITKEAKAVFPDGMGTVLALKILGEKVKGRVRGKDLMLGLCDYSASNNLAVALYGSTQKNLSILAGKLAKQFPGIKIASVISPPFRELTPEEDRDITEAINKSGADILFVSLSTPKQEKWMAQHKGKIKPVQLSVGAAFDFITGRVKEAPQWMQRAALEWLFRLFQQPGKVIRRMLLAPEFIARLSAQLIKERCFVVKKIV